MSRSSGRRHRARRGARSWPGTARIATGATIVIGLGAIGWSALILHDQLLIQGAGAAIDAQSRRTAQSLRQPNTDLDVQIDSDAPPQARLYDALRLVRACAAQPDTPERRDRLTRAIGTLDDLVGTRPAWGEAWVVLAYAHQLRDGSDAAVTRAALARSYHDAPYLRVSAVWRVGYAFDQWPALDAATRDRAINEAVWFSRSGQDEQDRVFAAARQSGAYRPFMNRWLSARTGDAGFDPLGNMAPQ